jgi:hypothetical protein
MVEVNESWIKFVSVGSSSVLKTGDGIEFLITDRRRRGGINR